MEEEYGVRIMDTVQIIKTQIGDLVWNQAQLVAQVNQLTKENNDLKKQLEDKEKT